MHKPVTAHFGTLAALNSILAYRLPSNGVGLLHSAERKDLASLYFHQLSSLKSTIKQPGESAHSGNPIIALTERRRRPVPQFQSGPLAKP